VITGDKDHIIVEKDCEKNVLNMDGTLRFNTWYDDIIQIEGLLFVSKNRKCNYIDRNGNFIFSEWIDACYEFVNGFAKVIKNKKINFIDKDGKLLSDKWFDGGCSFLLNGDYTVVYMLDKDGKSGSFDRFRDFDRFNDFNDFNNDNDHDDMDRYWRNKHRMMRGGFRMYEYDRYGYGYGRYMRGRMITREYGDQESVMMRLAGHVTDGKLDKYDLQYITDYIYGMHMSMTH